jgi:hypothetical protein
MIESHINATQTILEQLMATDAANNTQRWKSVSTLFTYFLDFFSLFPKVPCVFRFISKQKE